MYELNLVLLLFQQMCVFSVIAWLMSKTRLLIPLMQVTIRLLHKLLCYVTLSIFRIMGIYFDLYIEGSIVNTRVIGTVIDGLFGGPVVGGLVGLTDGLHHYSLEGMTTLGCMVSTVVKGPLDGLVHSVLAKRGRSDRVLNPLTAGATTFMIKLVQIVIILLVARPFQDALHLVQSTTTPTVVTSTVGIALFTHILSDKWAMLGKYTFTSSTTTLKITVSAEGILRQGFNEEGSMKVARVLTQESDIGAVAITDRDRLLAFIDIGDDHHLPGKPISSSYTQRAIGIEEVVYADGNEMSYRHSVHPHYKLRSTLVIPLRGENQRVMGAIKLHGAKNRLFSSINRTLGEGVAQLLSMQILAGQYERRKALLTRPEIKFLRAQVNPYFLFNAFNTLGVVIRRDSGQTGQLMQYLLTSFRKSLKRPTKIVTLADEIEHTNAYLQIEKIRSRANLQIQMTVPGGPAHHQLFAFALQPIVENTTKYGTSQHFDVDKITIHANQGDHWLQLDIEDSVGLYQANPQASGSGMNLVDGHLWARFGADYGISVTCEPERFTRVTPYLPLGENAR